MNELENNFNSINSNNISKKQLNRSPCPNLIFRENIVSQCDLACGLNECFDIFTSEKTSINYLIFPEKDTNKIKIIELESKNTIKTIENNSSKFIFIKYYKNIVDSKEYLVIISVEGLIKIFEISESDNFENINLLCSITTKKVFQNNWNFKTCALLFNIKIASQKYDILILSYKARYMEEYPTTIYNMKTGLKLKEIPHTQTNKTRFIIPWYNELDKNYYLIQCCEDLLIIISILFNDIYAKLDEVKYKSYSTGFVHKKNDDDFLFVANNCSEVLIYNLYKKELYHKIQIRKNKDNIRLYGLVLWSEDYLIVNDDTNKALIIIDIIDNCVISQISNNHNDSVRCVKRIKHKNYGECLLTGGDDHCIKLFSCDNSFFIPIFKI